MNDNKYYVYHWINDDTNLPFYVGKGSGNRYKSTKKNSRNPWFERIINKHNCHPEIIIDNLSEEEAFQKEIEIEQKHKALGYELCNLIPCGSAPPHFSGEKNGNYGNYWTEEQKKNVSNKMIETKCHAGSRNGRSKRCMCVETGVIHEYKSKFLEELGLKDVWSITVSCKNPTRTAKGFHFVDGDKIEELNTPERRQQYLDSIRNSRFTQ